MTDTATELTPMDVLKNMIATNVTRERVIRPSKENPLEVEFVEKNSLALVAMTQSDMANIAIEFLENSILHQSEIPGEKGGSENSENNSKQETINASENEGSTSSKSSTKK